MYIQTATIENIGPIDRLTMEFGRNPAGWHVLLGDNGAGKSSVLRAIALGLIGPKQAPALRQDWSRWLRCGQDKARVILDLLPESDREKQDFITNDPKKDNKPRVEFDLKRSEDLVEIQSSANPMRGLVWGGGSSDFKSAGSGPQRRTKDSGAWFSASYGPFRRFTGGSSVYENSSSSLQSIGSLQAHLSLFGEDIALTETLSWLKDLHYRKLSENGKRHGARALYDDVIEFINRSKLLPHGVHIREYSPDGLVVLDGEKQELRVDNLSDGYRSMLSMVLELVRQLVLCFGQELVFPPNRGEEENSSIELSGVVLIDEIDAHLHPTWQVRVGDWFRRIFPKMQFIVSTHSPFICHAAVEGTIWKLATPGTNEFEGQVTGIAEQRLVYGNILEALGTDLFGADVTRSQDSTNQLARLAKLNIKEIRKGLSDKERKERDKLRATLPTDSSAGSGDRSEEQ